MRSTIDPDGDWFSSHSVDDAEDWLRRKHRMSAPEHFEAPIAEGIRDSCKRIPRYLLTPLEIEFLTPGIEALSRRAKHAIDQATAKWRSAFRAPRGSRYAAPDEPFKLPDVTVKDPALLERARRAMGITTPHSGPELPDAKISDLLAE